MTIREAIRSADSERTICLLLTDYLARARLPDRLAIAKIVGIPDIWSCFQELVAELESQAGQTEVSPVNAIAEAVSVFDGAIDRLSQILGEGFDGGEASRNSRSVCETIVLDRTTEIAQIAATFPPGRSPFGKC